MGIKVIEIELTEIEELILQIMNRHQGGMTAERIRYTLDGREIPLSGYQVRKILNEMTILNLVQREKRSRSYIYLPGIHLRSASDDLNQIM